MFRESRFQGKDELWWKEKLWRRTFWRGVKAKNRLANTVPIEEIKGKPQKMFPLPQAHIEVEESAVDTGLFVGRNGRRREKCRHRLFPQNAKFCRTRACILLLLNSQALYRNCEHVEHKKSSGKGLGWHDAGLLLIEWGKWNNEYTFEI